MDQDDYDAETEAAFLREQLRLLKGGPAAASSRSDIRGTAGRATAYTSPPEGAVASRHEYAAGASLLTPGPPTRAGLLPGAAAAYDRSSSGQRLPVPAPLLPKASALPSSLAARSSSELRARAAPDSKLTTPSSSSSRDLASNSARKVVTHEDGGAVAPSRRSVPRLQDPDADALADSSVTEPDSIRPPPPSWLPVAARRPPPSSTAIPGAALDPLACSRIIEPLPQSSSRSQPPTRYDVVRAPDGAVVLSPYHRINAHMAAWLRPYQIHGVIWCYDKLVRFGGACLCDDMVSGEHCIHWCTVLLPPLQLIRRFSTSFSAPAQWILSESFRYCAQHAILCSRLRVLCRVWVRRLRRVPCFAHFLGKLVLKQMIILTSAAAKQQCRRC